MTYAPSVDSRVSLGICLVWSEPLLWALWVAEDPNLLHADSEDSEQTGWIPRLIQVFAGCTGYFVGFVMLRLILYLNHFLRKRVVVSLQPGRPQTDRSLDIPTIGIILSKQRITKALIKLRRCMRYEQVFSWHGSFAKICVQLTKIWKNSDTQNMSRHTTKPTMWRAPRESVTSLCAKWVAKDPSFLQVDSEDWSDWVDAQADLSHAGRICHFVGFVMRPLKLL